MITSWMPTYIYVLLTFLCALRNVEADVAMRPPDIVVGPADHVFKQATSVMIPCVSGGIPQPTQYLWKLNGSNLNMNDQNIMPSPDPTVGNFTLLSAGPLNQGYYQCVVSNSYGVAFSDVGLYRMATVLYNSGLPSTAGVTQGDSLRLTCNYQVIVPNALFSWSLVHNTNPPDLVPTPVQLSTRMNIDDDGNLFFANVLPADNQNNQYYKCDVRNNYLDSTIGGSYTRVNVAPRPSFTAPPTLAFSTASPVVGLLGRDIHLRCFFYGMPEVTNQWSGPGGVLPQNRYSIDNWNTQLTIYSLQWSDQGDYTCSGSTLSGTATPVKIHISIEAAPFWNVGPHNVNVTNGETVSVMCNATAQPAANIAWSINGQLYDGSHPRRIISQDRTNLTFINVCKSCPGGGSDLLVFQCNVSNNLGYVYGQGYLNVLDPIVITSPPANLTFTPRQNFTFTCAATSDPSTTVYYDWKLNDEYLVATPGVIVIDRVAGTLVVITSGDADGGHARTGRYTCVASNGVSNIEVNAYLNDYAGVSTAGIAQYWWIILLLLLLLLLALLIFCLVTHFRNNGGETYPVDDKERKHGHDPEKELDDGGFKDYQRPEDAAPVVKGSPTNLTYSSEGVTNPSYGRGPMVNGNYKMNDSDDEGSLADYADVDAGKFNEDGSFIGEYYHNVNPNAAPTVAPVPAPRSAGNYPTGGHLGSAQNPAVAHPVAGYPAYGYGEPAATEFTNKAYAKTPEHNRSMERTVNGESTV